MAASFLSVSANAAAQGSLKGHISFDGAVPPAEIVEVKSDVPICGTHKELPKIVLGADKGIANAVVRILGTSIKADPKKGRLDQVECQFAPRIQALTTGSTLTITSSDPVLHNAHAFYEDGSTAFNVAVPIAGMEINKKLSKPGIMKFRCDAGHTWMSAYIVVLDEPYYAMTDADGNFTIEGIPAGEYDVEVWHEWLGRSKQSVKIGEGPSNISFSLKEPA